MVAAPFGLSITEKLTPEAIAAELGGVPRPPVLWLHFQDCAGCTETLLRASHPDLSDVILNVISLDAKRDEPAPRSPAIIGVSIHRVRISGHPGPAAGVACARESRCGCVKPLSEA
jgi:DMSO/TMAO reductase YedYZ molybdopterin-dependent catalytic subunit